MTSLTRVIVAYNSGDVLRWQAARSEGLPTLLVDNASEDGTRAVAADLGYEVRALAANEGFGRGVMAGLLGVDSDLALVVNPDVAADASAVAALIAAAERYEDCDLFVPKLLGEDGTLFYRHESSLERRRMSRDVPDGPACIPMISGAAMLIRVRPFLEFGGFDPAIFLYFEDDDLALRYRAARRPIIYVPEAEVLHLGDRSSGPDRAANRIKDISFGWSRAYLMRKHGRGSRALCLAGMIAKLPVYLFAGRVQRFRRQIGRLRGFLRAVIGGPAPFFPERSET